MLSPATTGARFSKLLKKILGRKVFGNSYEKTYENLKKNLRSQLSLS